MEYDFSQELLETIRNRANVVRDSISTICKECGRNPDEVTLVGVSKVFPVEYAEAAVAGGLLDLGENRVQELVPKHDRLEELGLNPRWHLIGTLQKNKVKYIIGKTHLIHSVNTIDLAQEISKRSIANNIVSDILIQANISGEETKHGFSSEELDYALEQMSSLEGVRVRGLMTMAPIQEFDGQAREVFAKTRERFESLKSGVKDPSMWNVLSMGMSQDYKYAIMEGATHIRIGTSIFGDRTTVNS